MDTQSGIAASGLDAQEREFREEVNLAFLDAIISRCEALVDGGAYQRYALNAQSDEEAESYRQAAAQCEQEAERAAVDMERYRGIARQHEFTLPLDQLRERYALDEFETDVLSFALAPALDLSFRKRIARYKDNILLDFTDPDLVTTLLLSSRIERMRARDYFRRGSRLVDNRLIELVHPREVAAEELLSDELRLPTRVTNFLLGKHTLDKSIANLAELVVPKRSFDDVVLPEEVTDDVRLLIEHNAGGEAVGSFEDEQDSALILQFTGPPGTGKTVFAEAIAHRLGRRLLVVDCAKLASPDLPFRIRLEEIFFEAGVYGAVLVLDHCEAICSKSNVRLPTIYKQFEQYGGPVILITNDPKSLDFSLERWVAFSLKFESPDGELRERLWAQSIPEDLRLADDVDLQDLATLFELTGSKIQNAVQLARQRSYALPPGERVVTQRMLKHAAHAQLRADLDDYSSKSRIGLTLDHLVLPDDVMAQVRQLLDAAKHRTYVMNKWGFGKRLVTGKGIVSLFTGEPGTGKTLCAEILAAELELNLYQVAIPKIMSKYIGDTEKNIAKIFHAARASHSMLLFDEADALFTKRVKVERSVDRFSNMEVNLLLQEIERFEGIVIMTTNLERELDKAFQRRINFKIHFPFPDKDQRAKIWQSIIPPECPLAPGVEMDILADAFELAGGHIKNVVLRAAYVAAKDRDVLTLEHFRIAAEAECRSAGKLYRDIRELYDDYAPRGPEFTP